MSPRPASPPDPRERLAAWLASPEGRPELWVRVAWIVLASFVAMSLVLGARPGGPLPVWIFVQGRLVVGLAALGVLLSGLALCVRRPPFLRRGRLAAIVALVLVLGVANAPFPYPSSYEKHPSLVEFRLPVGPPQEPGEAWRVLWGGDDPRHNRLAELYPDRRFGLHLVLEREGQSRIGTGRRAEDHFAFGQPVLAPAAGRVLRVHGGELDRDGSQRWGGGEPLGNLIAIEVAPGEVLFLTNLRAGSIRVREGEAVVAGQPLAEVGWSGAPGATPEPHLALHLADDPRPRRGEGIPLRFHGYWADGRGVARGSPRGGLGPAGTRTGTLVAVGEP